MANSRRDLKREIARMIVLAQCASDGGKGNEPKFWTRYSSKTWYRGYDAKDELIMRAIRMIQCSKSSAFRFRVTQRTFSEALVYFEVRIDGMVYQVSFHSFSRELARLGTSRQEPYDSKGWHCKWDRESSYYSAIEIGHHYGVLSDRLYRMVRVS